MNTVCRASAALLALLLCCASTQAEEPVSVAGPVTLQVREQTAESAMLDVGIVIFDAGIPEDVSTHSELGVFPEIRRAESRYLPVNLRRALIDSNTWGVVRVIPQAADLPELLVEAKIIESTGLRLVLKLSAQDASGRLWLDKVYLDSAVQGDYPIVPGTDPYGDIYRLIANELLAVREAMSDKELRDIRRVALLRYAAGLSPEAFGEYLGRDESGLYVIQRLPAEGDSMVQRVERIRNQEYLFIDNVDEQYVELQQDMAFTYDLWRQYDQEQALYRQEYQQRALNREKQGPRGSFVALQQTYNAYKVSKTQEQDLDELALGFNNEVAPTIVETRGQVFKLSGTLDSQYQEWRAILREIFALELGLPAPDAGLE